jgi:beta,beta-carotene 9',10'-dioxygenase
MTGTIRTGFDAGFATLDREVVVDRLPVDGALPSWLAGTLIRNGPALFDSDGTSFRHWFDGQAMLHRFAFADGRVSYANRLLDTASARSVRERGRITYAEFATDPCASLFGRFFTRFRRKATPNANVNVTRIDNRSVAVTETPLAVEFDPQTLATIGVIGYDDEESGAALTTAHPHAVPATGDLVNYGLRFGRRSAYRVYRQPKGALRRELIGAIPADRPGYVHSFAITERYVVLAVFPLVVNPLSFLLRGRPFIENYRWRPELGTRIVVMSLEDGSIRGEYSTPAFFAFHHINAYDDGDEIVMDVCAYPDARVVDALYLDRLRRNDGVPMAVPTRYRIDLDGGGVQVLPLTDEPLELPRISYREHNGRPYRYAYGVGATDRNGHNFLDQLCKVDVTSGEVRTWSAGGCYAGEPVFVRAPGTTDEDDGVVLSIVLNPATNHSFLVVLDARSFEELARAEVPHAIPFGFHGQFTADRV